MDNYEDIINIKRFEPKYYKRMDIKKRAAQFSSFKALEGFDDLIKESGRIVDKKEVLTEDKILEINDVLNKINIDKNKQVLIIYYEKDKNKDKGKYLEYSGKIIKIDNFKKEIILLNKKVIRMEDVYNIDILS